MRRTTTDLHDFTLAQLADKLGLDIPDEAEVYVNAEIGNRTLLPLSASNVLHIVIKTALEVE